MTKACYVLRALDVRGTVTYYTGKAGVEYVSSRVENAFPFELLKGAQRKASVLNRLDAGWRFMPVGYVPNHGIVPASAMEALGVKDIIPKSKAKDSANRRARLHRALDAVLDAGTVGNPYLK